MGVIAIRTGVPPVLLKRLIRVATRRLLLLIFAVSISVFRVYGDGIKVKPKWSFDLAGGHIAYGSGYNNSTFLGGSDMHVGELMFFWGPIGIGTNIAEGICMWTHSDFYFYNGGNGEIRTSQYPPWSFAPLHLYLVLKSITLGSADVLGSAGYVAFPYLYFSGSQWCITNENQSGYYDEYEEYYYYSWSSFPTAYFNTGLGFTLAPLRFLPIDLRLGMARAFYPDSDISQWCGIPPSITSFYAGLGVSLGYIHVKKKYPPSNIIAGTTIKNEVISPGGNGVISLILQNKNKWYTGDIQIHTTVSPEYENYIYVSGRELTELKPWGKVTMQIPVQVSLDAPEGEVTLNITGKERGKLAFTIPNLKIRIEEIKKDTLLPLISIFGPQDRTRFIEGNITVNGVVLDDIEVEKVLINGNPITQKRGISILPKIEYSAADTFYFSEDVSLASGSNVISVEAFDKAGNNAIKTITVEKIAEIVGKEMPKLRAQRWAVVIGISEYKNSHKGIPNLRYADRDAQTFYDFLRSPEGGGFPVSHARLLLNEEATTKNVKDALYVFLSQAIEEDIVIIYFAGHGAPEPANPENLYLITHDTDPGNLATTAFPMWDIETALKRYIKSERVIMFTDACHSAGVAEELTMRDISRNLINKYLSHLESAGKGRAVFTASETGESSQESKKWGGGHGVFTYYLLEGLKGEADYNSNGTVTLGEITVYVTENVKRATRSNQHPTMAGKFDVSLPMGMVK